MTVKHIESSKNPTIRDLAELKERKARDKEQRYLIEGTREVSRAIEAGEKLQALLYVKELLDEKKLRRHGAKSKKHRTPRTIP